MLSMSYINEKSDVVAIPQCARARGAGAARPHELRRAGAWPQVSAVGHVFLSDHTIYCLDDFLDNFLLIPEKNSGLLELTGFKR